MLEPDDLGDDSGDPFGGASGDASGGDELAEELSLMSAGFDPLDEPWASLLARTREEDADYDDDPSPTFDERCVEF